MNDVLIAEYEQMLLNDSKSFPSEFFKYTPEVNMSQALTVIRYVLEKYLRWDPIKIRDLLSYPILEKLKLMPFMQYIIFPVELDPHTDLFYIAWLLYPATVHISQKDLILNVYKKLLDGSLAKYPKEFYTGTIGELRAILCLRYVLEHEYEFESIEDMYSYFASNKINNALKKYKLEIICRDLFGTPVEFLHEALSDNQKDEFLFQYNRFKYIRRKMKLQNRVSKRNKKNTEGKHE